MVEYPGLSHIDIGLLIGEAGNPWQIDDTLQSGDAGQIAELATAFRTAGVCTSETSKEFLAAQARFKASWNEENGTHPINDSEEVQRATTQLYVQADQLPAIAVDLQNIAADLAEAQRMSDLKIDKLNGVLHAIDSLIGTRLDNDEDISDLEDRAMDETRSTEESVDRFRDDYANKLQAALTDLRLKHGYDPAAIEDVDGDAELGQQQRAESGTAQYGAGQKAKDEALVNSGGPMTPEKTAAAGRLSDFATASDPNASADGRRLAGERLDDFRMANFVGPLPKDPLFGGDARSRAQNRLALQSQLEQGFPGLPPMTRDQATQLLDSGDQLGRVTVTKQAYFALTRAGMSDDGAKAAIGAIAENGGLLATGVETYTDGVPDGKHALVTGLSPEDAKVLGTIASHAGRVADVIQLGMAANDWLDGGEHRNEELGGALGSVAGGNAAAWGAAMVAGSFTGPWTTAAIVVAAAIVGGAAGDQVGSGIGGMFDPKVAPAGGSW
jgi:hypothetical protein